MEYGVWNILVFFPSLYYFFFFRLHVCVSIIGILTLQSGNGLTWSVPTYSQFVGKVHFCSMFRNLRLIAPSILWNFEKRSFLIGKLYRIPCFFPQNFLDQIPLKLSIWVRCYSPMILQKMSLKTVCLVVLSLVKIGFSNNRSPKLQSSVKFYVEKCHVETKYNKTPSKSSDSKSLSDPRLILNMIYYLILIDQY